MAKVYRGDCTTCGYVTPNIPYTRRARARVLRHLREHVCRPAPVVVLTPQRCACCGHEFLLLVDDGNLCIGCDARLYPAAG